MSARGIYAHKLGPLIDGTRLIDHCSLIGRGVPPMHLPASLPLYLVVEHPLGEDRLMGARMVKLLAYPSDWPGPGDRTPDVWIDATHELAVWSGLIPVFDTPKEVS